MAEPPKEDRDRRTDEDLFEDLGQFFAPLDDDWPEEEGAEPPGRPAGSGEGLEPASPPASAPEAPPPPPEPESPAIADVPAGSADDLAGEDEWVAEATGEMRTEAWDLADEEPEVAPPAASPRDAPITAADLRTPPPAYADLPEPRDEPPATAPPPTPPSTGEDEVLADEATMDDLEVPVGFDEDILGEDEPPIPSAGDDTTRPEEEDVQSPTVEVEGLERPEEPEEDDVEAAAEHFAEGIRVEPEDVERDLLGDLGEPTTSTAPIDRDAVLERVAEGEPEPAAPAGLTVAAAAGAAGAAGASGEPMQPPPAWEEAGSAAATESEEPKPAPSPGQRDLVAAFVSGIVLLVVAIVLLAIDKGAFAVLAGAVILLAQGELYAVMRRRGFEPATLLGLAMGALIVAGAYLRGEGAMLFGLTLAMLFVVLWYMVAPPGARQGTLRDAGATLLGIVYVPFLGGFAMLLLRAPEELGRNLFLVVVGLTVLYDISAYAIGSIWGSRPLAPTISPQKSWEGAAGATLILLIAALAIVPGVEPFSTGIAIGLAFVIALAAPLGDLVESALKRDLRVKDMSGLLPGHGGMLDRIDAILFAAPAAYWFLRIAFTG